MLLLAGRPVGQVGWGDDPYHLASLGDQDRSGLAVLECAQRGVHPGIRGHHDLLAQRDHELPQPTTRSLVQAPGKQQQTAPEAERRG